MGENWVERLFGGIVVAIAAYFGVFFGFPEFGTMAQLAIAIGCGIVAFAIGGSIWSWIEGIFWWS